MLIFILQREKFIIKYRITKDTYLKIKALSNCTVDL